MRRRNKAQNRSYVPHHQQVPSSSESEPLVSIRFSLSIRALTTLLVLIMVYDFMLKQELRIGMYVKDNIAYCYLAPTRRYYGKTIPDFQQRVTLAHRKLHRHIRPNAETKFPKWMRDYL